MTESIEKNLEIIVKAIDDKRAEDIIALDMEGISLITDYNVITHGNSERQIGSIADGVLDAADEHGIEVRRIEGKNSSKWILIDLNDIVVHIFNAEERDFFKLERLWTEAQDVDLSKWIGNE